MAVRKCEHVTLFEDASRLNTVLKIGINETAVKSFSESRTSLEMLKAEI
jgi:hypothetical protein